jgi:phosphoribosyl 1,2-cyclic phosphodiesterase
MSYQEKCVEHYTLGSMVITPIALSHPNQGSGYKFEEDDKCFVFLTDNELDYKHQGGLDYQAYLEFSRGADLLFHDAEYKKEEYKKTRGWGHSCYEDAMNLALDAGVKKFGLFHHNQERIDDEIDTIVNDCCEIIKKSGKKMECSAVGQLMQFKL